jgi:hypothetical protein
MCTLMCSLLFGVPNGQNLTERLVLLAKVVVVNRAVKIGLPGLQLEVNRSIEMQKLITGVHDFQNRVFDKHRELFERLSQGQNPEALFITCSDSRINPNMITQTEPGDLFILRNAGNIVPPFGATNGGEAGTIEFAVSALGVRDIIVCGHSLCGAMKGHIRP